MNKIAYETVMVINTNLGENGISAIVEKFKSLIETNGVIDGDIQEWGTRKLAYEIDDQRDGYYVLINFTSDAKFPAELARVYKITDGILRYLVIKKELKLGNEKSNKKIKSEKVVEKD